MDDQNFTEEQPCTFSVIEFYTSEMPKDYLPMIYSRWLRSLRNESPIYKKIPSKTYYSDYHKYIENLLSKPDSMVHLAVLSDDNDIVLGFAVTREDVLDYVHVHTDYRKNGIAKAIVPKDITTFTHLTSPALLIWQGKDHYKHLKFNPRA